MSAPASTGTLPWGRSLLTLAAVHALFGFGLGNFPFLIIALLLAGAAFAHRIVDPPRLTLARYLEAKQVRAGDTVTVTLDAQAPTGAGPFTLHDALPDEARLATGRNFHAVTPTSGDAATVAYGVTLPRRGVRRIGVATATAPDPLAAGAARTIAIVDPTEVVVQANATAAPRVRAPNAWGASFMPGGDRAVRGTMTNDFRELRPYNRGDPLKSVNWKATARASTDTLSLVVNDYEVEGKKAVWVFLDASHYTSGGRTTASRFDDLANGALTLARHFLDRGHRVGFTLFGGAEAQVLHPDSGTTQERRIANLLTYAEPATKPGTGLAAAVERVRGFLARERPVAFVFTLVGRDATLAQGVTEARALSSTGRRPGVVAVLAPAPRQEDGLPGRVLAVREALQTRALTRLGVHAMTWDERHPLGAILAHGGIAP